MCFNPTCCLHGPEHWIFGRKCSVIARNENGPLCSAATQKGQKGHIPQRIPEAAIMPALESFIIASDLTLTVPVTFVGRCANPTIIVTEDLDLRDANGLFFCVC